MNLQNHFNAKRFFLLFKNDLLLNYKSYIFSAIGYALILYFAILYFMTSSDRIFDSENYLTFFMISILAMFLFSGSSFPAFNAKNTAQTFIMSPGSNLEKFCIQFLVRVVFGLLFLIISIWIISHFARITALQFESVKLSEKFIDSFRYSMLTDGYTGENYKLFTYLVAFTFGISVFSFRLFFKRFAFVKSSILIVGLIIILIFVMNILSYLFFPESTNGIFDLSPFFIFGNTFLYGFKGGSLILLTLSFIFILPLGYFKLKEKQL
jgi:hypothetical protein